MKNRNIMKIFVTSLLTFALVISANAVSSSNTQSKTTVSLRGGALMFDGVPQINIGEHKLKATAAQYKIKDTQGKLKIVDARGTFEGWRITVKLSEFQKPDGTPFLHGSSLAFLPVQEDNTGQFGHLRPSQMADKVEIISGDDLSQQLFRAVAGKGNGPWDLNLKPSSIYLYVPEAAGRSGDYTAELTWALVSAP